MCFQCKDKCSKGVPVADELRFLAYNDFKGNFSEAREGFWNLPKEIRNIQCSDCSECVIQCPNGVKVHERLIRAQELLAYKWSQFQNALLRPISLKFKLMNTWYKQPYMFSIGKDK